MDESEVPLISPRSTRHVPELRATVGVIGTGNFAVAITKRLISAGHDVIMGSRRPSKRETNLTGRQSCLCGAQLTTIGDCLSRCDIIIVALHMESFKVTLEKYAEQTRGKVLVDVSNREYRYTRVSNAEYLASILPNASVVKAFNTISAYSMEEYSSSASYSNQKVFVSSDDSAAKARVTKLASSMGFQAVDMGGLKSSLYTEEFVLKVFSHWKVPIFLTFLIFNLWSLYIVYIYFIERTAYNWEQIFLKVFNKPLCMTALTVLALTYLPGQLASVLQVVRGTKHRPFPRFLNTWLKSRKQLGLISFFLVCLHVIASVLMLSPTYYRSWYHVPAVTFSQGRFIVTDSVDVDGNWTGPDVVGHAVAKQGEGHSSQPGVDGVSMMLDGSSLHDPHAHHRSPSSTSSSSLSSSSPTPSPHHHHNHFHDQHVHPPAGNSDAHKAHTTPGSTESALTSDSLDLDMDFTLPVSPAWMVWKGEAACLAGATAFLLLTLIALTSIPSVGESFNWAEWRCVHSKVSYMALLVSVAHVCIMGGPGWAKGGLLKTMRSITFLSIVLPSIVLFLKLVFILPPLRGYLRKIRRGWERDADSKALDADLPYASRPPHPRHHHPSSTTTTTTSAAAASSSCCSSSSSSNERTKMKDEKEASYVLVDVDGRGFKPMPIKKTCNCSDENGLQNFSCSPREAVNSQCRCSSL